MKSTQPRLIDTTILESKFIFAHEDIAVSTIRDNDGSELAFYKSQNGNQVIFTKDTEGVAVAVEHCNDGGKIYHLSQDSKGLPAMHEFKADGSETMYLLSSNNKLEKMVENKLNGDKISSWFYPEELVVLEQRQQGGIIFKLSNESGEGSIWLHNDGMAIASGVEGNIKRLQEMFSNYLDGAEF